MPSGGRGTSMATWFKQNRKAQTLCDKFIAERKNGDPSSVRQLLDTLISKHGFPFSSEPSLVRKLKAEGMGAVIVAAKPVSIIEDKHHQFVATKRRATRLDKATRFVVTAAQNNTEPDEGFLAALEVYCRRNKAELIVRPIRYKNPTNALTPEAGYPEGMWWDERLDEYLLDTELELRDVVIPDVRIAATSGNPLSGLDARSGAKHGVFAATQLQMRTVPTPQQKLPKILYSTGAVTVQNYSTTKSGNLAEFHHSLSAVVVEECQKSGNTFMRALSWDGECFIDIDRAYFADRSEKAERWEALIPGDEHAWFHDPSVRFATYDAPKSMTKVGKPRLIVRHDLLDCYSVSHHHMGNAITRTNKAVHGWGNLEEELHDTIRFLNDTTPKGSVNLIVSSNHNDHLTQWLAQGEKGVTPENALMYHKLMAAVLESSHKTPTGVGFANPFKAWASDKINGQVEFLGGTESYMVKDIDVAMHGHRGPNGARGSARNLANIGVKSVIGHSHSPNIYRGVHQVGTSSRLDLEYAAGPSSWLHCHAVIHANGKRQLLPIIGGEWRARS